ncbi:MAG: nucleotidyltransferase domain-containing protein [Caldilineaceae bacterium]|nr:nucleotidyltransferase domain-containing protein [Caldilineaceae bacterium]
MLEKILTTKQLPVWADQYAQAVAAAYQPDCIILFGSVARGEQDTDSDIDILVIGGELPGDQRSRFRELMRLRPVLAPIQVHAYSRDEWESMMAQQHLTVLEALHDGQALYGESLFKQWRRRFHEWEEQGLQRTGCSWVVPNTTLHDSMN